MCTVCFPLQGVFFRSARFQLSFLPFRAYCKGQPGSATRFKFAHRAGGRRTGEGSAAAPALAQGGLLLFFCSSMAVSSVPGGDAHPRQPAAVSPTERPLLPRAAQHGPDPQHPASLALFPGAQLGRTSPLPLSCLHVRPLPLLSAAASSRRDITLLCFCFNFAAVSRQPLLGQELRKGYW